MNTYKQLELDIEQESTTQINEVLPEEDSFFEQEEEYTQLDIPIKEEDFYGAENEVLPEEDSFFEQEEEYTQLDIPIKEEDFYVAE